MGGLDGATTNFVKKYYMQCVPLQGIHMPAGYTYAITLWRAPESFHDGPSVCEW